MKRICREIIVAVVFTAMFVTPAKAQVYNGDFSLGLNGWTTFLPPSNTLWPDVEVALFDIDGPGPLGTSPAFHVNVGSDALLDLQQPVVLTAGVSYHFHADLAMTPPGNNADGGTIRVYVGPSLLASYSFGGTTVGVTEYASISGTYQPAVTGAETLSIDFSRDWGIGIGWQTPNDWIDNIQLTPIPEPSAVAIIAAASGLMAIVGRRKVSFY